MNWCSWRCHTIYICENVSFPQLSFIFYFLVSWCQCWTVRFHFYFQWQLISSFVWIWHENIVANNSLMGFRYWNLNCVSSNTRWMSGRIHEKCVQLSMKQVKGLFFNLPIMCQKRPMDYYEEAYSVEVEAGKCRLDVSFSTVSFFCLFFSHCVAILLILIVTNC